MLIKIAGEEKEVRDEITVSELIVEEKVENAEYVTVSLNDEFLKRADFETIKLKENDSIEFIYFMGGGCF